jgi:hypothetical protein
VFGDGIRPCGSFLPRFAVVSFVRIVCLSSIFGSLSSSLRPLFYCNRFVVVCNKTPPSPVLQPLTLPSVLFPELGRKFYSLPN